MGIDLSDPRLCGRCVRGWGSVIVTPPPGYFSLLNTRTGKLHGARQNGTRTACGQTATSEKWKRLPSLPKEET